MPLKPVVGWLRIAVSPRARCGVVCLRSSAASERPAAVRVVSTPAAAARRTFWFRRWLPLARWRISLGATNAQQQRYSLPGAIFSQRRRLLRPDQAAICPNPSVTRLTNWRGVSFDVYNGVLLCFSDIVISHSFCEQFGRFSCEEYQRIRYTCICLYPSSFLISSLLTRCFLWGVTKLNLQPMRVLEWMNFQITAIFYFSRATFLTERRGLYEISVTLRTDQRPTTVPGRAFPEELKTAISP